MKLRGLLMQERKPDPASRDPASRDFYGFADGYGIRSFRSQFSRITKPFWGITFFGGGFTLSQFHRLLPESFLSGGFIRSIWAQADYFIRSGGFCGSQYCMCW